MKAGKFIVVSSEKKSGRCSMSAKPVEHETEELAKTEAARLALTDNTRTFTVLQVVATAAINVVTWL